MEGVAEYTTFEVKLESKEEKMNRASEQFSLDKDLLRLCIMRCFHPDKLMQEIRSFIVHFLGKHFVEIPILNFSKLFKRTSKRTIVLFMCGPNVNCLQELYTLKVKDPKADKAIIEYQPLGSISLEKIAKLIIRAACKGSWLLLDNLQLSLQIIPNLVRFFETMFESELEAKTNME